ncbi:MAG: DNA polymerase III subunit delta [Erysipelotrichaceae bacterium]|nr:DNA polymerase III subunit delta [Erysipelotrichaceae bacterium]
MNIVLYGDEPLLLEQKLDELKERYDISDEQMNLSVYYPQETSMSEILADALTQPFLSEYKMVVIKDPLFLTKARQKDVSEEDIKALTNYLKHDNPSTVLVIYRDVMDFDGRKGIVKTLKKSAQFIQLEKVTAHQLYQATRDAIKKRGSQIDDDALDLLLERTGNDLMTVLRQVEKLTLYTPHIDVAAVNALVEPLVEERAYMLTSAFLHHDLESTLRIYNDLIIQNNEPIMLIATMANAIRQLYQVKIMVRLGYNDKDIVKTLGMNPRAIFPVRKNAETFELNDLAAYLNDLADLDQKVKSGLIDRYRGLELFLMNAGN